MQFRNPATRLVAVALFAAVWFASLFAANIGVGIYSAGKTLALRAAWASTVSSICLTKRC
jgi:hypothetical protein